MKKILQDWYNQYFSNPEIIIILVILLIGLLVVSKMGAAIAPLLASIVIAYLLSWFIELSDRLRVPHSLSVLLVYCFFIACFLLALIFLVPLLWRQTSNLLQEVPTIVTNGQALLLELPKRYPHYITADQVTGVLTDFRTHFTGLGRLALSFSVMSITTVVLVSIYLILVPLLVYFFLKDQVEILAWSQKFLPRKRTLLKQVWQEVNAQIGNYVRGRVVEIMIVAGVCFAVFSLMGLRYAALLSVGVGLSVIIPYIGAVVITIPVLVMALLQWGLTPHFFNLLLAYAVIIILDANLLVPLLFSEAMSLHPVAIIASILVFGGCWGFWGVFFAIPLASLVRAILNLIGAEVVASGDEAVSTIDN